MHVYLVIARDDVVTSAHATLEGAQAWAEEDGGKRVKAGVRHWTDTGSTVGGSDVGGRTPHRWHLWEIQTGETGASGYVVASVHRWEVREP